MTHRISFLRSDLSAALVIETPHWFWRLLGRQVCERGATLIPTIGGGYIWAWAWDGKYVDGAALDALLIAGGKEVTRRCIELDARVAKLRAGETTVDATAN